MDPERIEKARLHAETAKGFDGQMAGLLANDCLALLAALREAQAENARLREALAWANDRDDMFEPRGRHLAAALREAQERPLAQYGTNALIAELRERGDLGLAAKAALAVSPPADEAKR